MPNLFEYSYRVIPLSLAVGLTDFELVTDAEKIVYASPTDGPEISVKLQLRANDGIPLRPQGELVAPFQRIYITSAAISKTIYLLLGSPKDIQLTGRDVAISGTLNSREYQSYVNSIGQLFEAVSALSVVGTGAYHQLKNPTGSGKTIELLYAEIDANAVIGINYGQLNTDLGSLVKTGRNHQMASAVGSGEVRQNTVSGGITDIWGSFNLWTNNPFKYMPLVVTLDPGEGFAFQAASGTHQTAVRFVWREF